MIAHKNEMLQSILSIVDTGLEGMDHILKSIRQERGDACLYLLSDFVEGYLFISRAIGVLGMEMNLEALKPLMDLMEEKLCIAMDLAIEGNQSDVRQFLEGVLIPETHHFRKGCAECFNGFGAH